MTEFDPWKVIDKYFERDMYYLTSHHLDSYNQFVYGDVDDEIGIKYIITRNNPIKIYKSQQDDGKFKHEILIYLAETRDAQGDIEMSAEENIVFGKPVLDSKDSTSYMYPNLARNYNTTYGCNVFINVTIIIKEDNEVVHHEVRQRINMGKIPIMIHSDLCYLKNQDKKTLRQLGECPYDRGGYFIIKGKEKVIISQEKKADNMMYITKSSDDKYTFESNLKSVSKEGYQSSRTTNIAILKDGSIDVRIYGLSERIPLFILFRALGIQSDTEICKYILNEDPYHLSTEGRILMQALMPCIKKGQSIYNEETALKYIGLKVSGSVIRRFIIDAKHVLNQNFLSNYGNYNLFKTYYLGYMVKKLLKSSLGMIPLTDRDHYKNKRAELSGFLMNELYRELVQKFIENIRIKVDLRFKFDYENEKLFTDMKDLIHDGNINNIFDYNIIEHDLNKSFTSRWGTETSSRDDIVQDINRNTVLGTVSIMRRLTFPFDKTSKAIGPRKLHCSQWGFVCPTESPDGGNVGIVNNLTIGSSISFWVNPSGIIRCLKDLNMISLEFIVPEDTYILSKVFVNNMWLGNHKNPLELYNTLKLYKYNGIINILTSIYWDKRENEIYISTEQGRLIRPVIRLDSNNNKLFTKEYNVEGKEWNDFVFGNRKILDKKCRMSDPSYYKDDVNMEDLKKNKCIIEYIDSNETENCIICSNYKNLSSKDVEDTDYTHCEIHNSFMFSAVVNTVPFPQHSPAVRSVYASHQMKQTMGIYNTNYGSRFETFSHILHYPQRPLVDSKYSKYVFSRNLPSGINAIVAIASYTGYNQEDSIILNEASVERGMFQSLYHRTYQDEEEDTSKTGGFKNETSRFCNPDIMKRTRPVSNRTKLDYSKLDDNGIIPLNTKVTEDDVLIGKFNVTENVDENGSVILEMSGKTVNNGTSGTVDKIILVEKDHSLRLAKVRIRKIKKPETGDKFAARSGQKGTIGLILPAADMPFTKDGIVPDIIMNPHAIPSRMTINQLLECVLGKTAVHLGNIGNSTAFEQSDVENITDTLENCGYEKYGNEILYNGFNGEQINTSIFIAPTYYQRLKLLVSDKIQSRSTGPKDYFTRQAASGRANKGGLRIGEMERDAILSHGAAGFLQETTMKRSDDYQTFFNNRNGYIINKNLYESDTSNINTVALPYSMKLFLQELQGMSISSRLVLEQNDDDKILHKLIPQVRNDFLMDQDEDDGVEFDINAEDGKELTTREDRAVEK